MLSGIGLMRSRIGGLERAREADAVAGESRVGGQREQHVDPRDRSSECTRWPNPGSRVPRGSSPRRRARCAVSGNDSPLAPRALEPRRNQLHAGRSGAAVLVADGEDAGRDRRRRRLAIAGRREPRRGARRRAGAVVRRPDQDRVDQPALGRRRQPLVMQQEDQIGERRPPHQFEDVVSADPDVCRAGVDDGGAPGVHCQWLDITSAGGPAGGCYGNRTVTPLFCCKPGANVPPATEMSLAGEVRR